MVKLYEIIYPIKYKLVFLEKKQGAWFQKRIKKLSKLDEIYKLAKEKVYKVEKESPAYIDNNYRVYYLDYDTGVQLTYNQVKGNPKPEELDSILDIDILEKIKKSVVDTAKDKILWFVIGFAIGGLLVYGIMSSVMQSKITEILQEQIPTQFYPEV